MSDQMQPNFAKNPKQSTEQETTVNAIKTVDSRQAEIQMLATKMQSALQNRYVRNGLDPSKYETGLTALSNQLAANKIAAGDNTYDSFLAFIEGTAKKNGLNGVFFLTNHETSQIKMFISDNKSTVEAYTLDTSPEFNSKFQAINKLTGSGLSLLAGLKKVTDSKLFQRYSVAFYYLKSYFTGQYDGEYGSETRPIAFDSETPVPIQPSITASSKIRVDLSTVQLSWAGYLDTAKKKYKGKPDWFVGGNRETLPASKGKVSEVRAHKGMDVYAPVGTPVYSVLENETIYYVRTNQQPGFVGSYQPGIIVTKGKLDGNEVYIVYGHLGEVRPGLKIGDPVKRGERLGGVGQFIGAAGSHLHLEVLGGLNMEFIYPATDDRFGESKAIKDKYLFIKKPDESKGEEGAMNKNGFLSLSDVKGMQETKATSTYQTGTVWYCRRPSQTEERYQLVYNPVELGKEGKMSFPFNMDGTNFGELYAGSTVTKEGSYSAKSSSSNNVAKSTRGKSNKA